MQKIISKLIPGFVRESIRNYERQAQIKNSKGNNVVCPVCNSTFSVFAPFGIIKRENAQCLNCGSLERHRLLWKYIAEKTDLFVTSKKLSVMHFAPEEAFYNFFAEHKNIEYIPCDLFPEIFKYKKSVTIEKIDITNIAFPDNYVDVIICNYVLNCIPDEKLAFSELRRVMKKTGWGVFQVPIDVNREFTYEDSTIVTPEARERAFGMSECVRWYGRDYADRLKNAGFDVVVDDYITKFSTEDLARYGLMGSEMIYLVRKI